MKNFAEINRASTGAKKTFNFFEKLWEHSRTLRRVGLVLVMCLTLGVTHAWAYDLYLYTGYFSDGGNTWETSSARFVVGAKNNDCDGTEFTSLGNHWYKCTAPGTGSYYIKRCNSTKSEKWNATSSMSISSSNNVIRINGWTSGEFFSMYIAGNNWNSIGSWSNNNSNGKMTPSGSTFTKSFTNVAASAHLFKVVEKGTWDRARNWNSGTVTGVNCAVQDDGSNNHNIQFTPYIATGTTTITYDVSTGEITVTCPKIPITLDKNSGSSDGSATVDVGASSLSTISHASRTSWNLTGYWTASSGGYKVINADGTFVDYNSNVSTYLNNATPSTWKKTSATTLYAQWTQDPTISLSLSSSTAVRGDAITLTAATTNASTPTIVYEYSTSSTFASAVTSIASTTSTSQSWTVPAGTSGTTYYLRAKMTISSTTYYSDILSLTAYGKKTIKVKDTNGWGANFKIHRWGGSADATEWPGETTNITSAGGQWKQVVLLSSSTNFLFCNGETTSTADKNKTANQTYDGMSDDGCYEIATGPGGSLALTSTANCPAKPTVTASAATSKTNTTATMNGNISSNGNDNITDYGFYWSTTYTTAAALQSSGTKVQKGTSNYTGSLTHGLTGLTAATTVYYIAFATNGQGTTLSSVQNFVVPYSVTITKPTGCSSITPAAGTYYYATGFEVTTVAATGYTFDSWSTSNGATSSASSPSTGTNKVTFTPSANSATIQPVYTANTYTITFDDQDATSAYHKKSATIDYKSGYFNDSYPDLEGSDLPWKTAYTFQGWYTGEGGTGLQITDAYGSLQSSKEGYTDGDGKWIHDDDATLYAKWTQSSAYGYLDIYVNNNGGTGGGIVAVYNSSSLESFTASTRTGYNFQGFFTDDEGGDKVINADGSIVSGSVTGFVTSGKWTNSSSSANIYAQWLPIEYTITFAHNDHVSYLGSESGTAPDDMAVDYTTSVTMPKAGDAKIFTRDGYELNGWAVAAHKAKGSVSETLLVDYDYRAGYPYSKLTTEDGATVTLYPKWLGNIYTISLNARGGSVYPTSINVRYGETYGTGYYGELPEPLAPTGKEFIGWYTSPTGGTRVTKDTQLTTKGAHTLYARYSDIAMVYFKNTIGWEEVYVTYDAYWDNTNGTGNNGKIYHKMSKVAGTDDIYYDRIPATILSDWAHNIAFNSEELLNDGHAPKTGDYGNYNKGEVVFRHDFDSIAPMFVPKNTNDMGAGEGTDGNYPKNSAKYISSGYSGESSAPKYTSGYWMKYGDTNSGYTLTYQKDGGSWTSGLKMNATKAGENVFEYTLKLDANSQYNFAFYKDYKYNNKSRQFNYRTQITSAACTDLKLVCDPNNAWMQTTAAGEYKFILTCADDGHMYLTVKYPLAVNDYQVLYSWNDGSDHEYASEVIKANAGTVDTISVFVHKLYTPVVSRSMKLQKCMGIAAGVPTWTDVTLGGITLSGEDITKNGVYNFEITQPESGDPTGAFAGKYEGDYYIRTTCSDGGWDYYKEREDNVMTYSAYSMTQTLSDPYSHYYCRYVGSTSTDITFAVATKYSPNISGIMTGDATIGNAATKLPANANVRFSWNEETNALARAYIKDAQGSGNARFMVMHGADDKIFNPNGSAIPAAGSLEANELQFDDKGDWIYQVMLQAKPGAAVSIIANYNGSDRYLVGGASSWETIMGGSGDSQYTIMAIYDFKTNRLMNAWTPEGDITDDLSDIDMLWIRYRQNSAQQITFNGGSLANVKAVGAIELRYNDLVGHVASWTPETRPLLRYFISFPFDVNVSDIFGLHGAEFGREYVIRKYDGAERAKNGLFLGDGDTYWIDLTVDSVMHAYEGYSLVFDNEYMNGDLGSVWENKTGGSSVYLYFPAAAEIASISDANKGTTLAEHLCQNTRSFDYKGATVSHANSDSHWNLIGSSLFVDSYVCNSSGTNGQAGDKARTTLDSYYAYNTEYNYWEPELYHKGGEYYACKAMHAMLVQFAGSVTWSKNVPPALAPSRERKEETVSNLLITLNLLQNGADGDRTYIKMDEDGNSDFMLCEDLFKIDNKKIPNIFSYASGNAVAYNKVAVESQTINLGIDIRKNDTYTFEMSENVAGQVTLIDNFAQTRTNLNMENYEIYLNKGNYYDRFSIEININKVPTAIDGVTDGQGSLKDGKAHKFIMNDQMYILKDGVLYDARGNRVK